MAAQLFVMYHDVQCRHLNTTIWHSYQLETLMNRHQRQPHTADPRMCPLLLCQSIINVSSVYCNLALRHPACVTVRAVPHRCR